MPKKAYDWKQGHIPLIGEHSLAKHRILREYVETYIEVLTKDPRVERLRLTLVDGFAGGGIYRKAGSSDLHFGSPAILLGAAAAATARVNASRVKPVRVEPIFFFIEKEPEIRSVLEETLRQHVYPHHPGASPTLLTGPFEDHARSIIAQIKSVGRAHRAIFLLDQYGYTDVPLPLLQEIFRDLPNAEVFMTLATGWISAYLHTASDAATVLRERMGIRTEISEEEIEAMLLGSSDDSRLKLRLVQQLLHDAFVRNSGARHFTPFFIVSRESNRLYWFLHLANSAKANDVVKELHWRVQNHFSHFGDAGLSMLGFDPYVDPAQLSFCFDDDAHTRARKALMNELPAKIRANWPSGISFDELYKRLVGGSPEPRDSGA